MQLHEIAAEFIKDTQASMWPGFAPEIVICLTILLMLLVRVFRFGRLIPGAVMAMAGVVVALYFQLGSAAVAESHEIFTGMLVLDTFIYDVFKESRAPSDMISYRHIALTL